MLMLKCTGCSRKGGSRNNEQFIKLKRKALVPSKQNQILIWDTTMTFFDLKLLKPPKCAQKTNP